MPFMPDGSGWYCVVRYQNGTPPPLLPSAIMADVRYTINPPLDAERT